MNAPAQTQPGQQVSTVSQNVQQPVSVQPVMPTSTPSVNLGNRTQPNVVQPVNQNVIQPGVAAPTPMAQSIPAAAMMGAQSTVQVTPQRVQVQPVQVVANPNVVNQQPQVVQPIVNAQNGVVTG